MTRINIVPPEELHSKHLLAEYRELPRVFKLARTNVEIPSAYRLGPGHVTFFFDKLEFLFKRQVTLVDEMKSRGFRPNFDPQTLLIWSEKKPECWNDYKPTDAARELNRERIQLRLQEMQNRNSA